MRIRIVLFCLIIFLGLALSGCVNTNQNFIIDDAAKNDSNGNLVIEHRKMTQEEAKKIISSGTAHILLDVRTQQEYDERHIAGAILIPVDQLRERAENELTDKNALILVYCRSGVRSKNAFELLTELGYTNVFDIGGIITWEI